MINKCINKFITSCRYDFENTDGDKNIIATKEKVTTSVIILPISPERVI